MIKNIQVIVWVCLALILIPNITAGSIYQNESIVLDGDEEYNIGLTDIEKNESISFQIDANKTINLYLINENEYAKRHIYEFNKSDLMLKEIKDISFNWTVPDKEAYMMILENPHNLSVEIEYTFHSKNYTIDLTETDIVEGLMCCCCGLIGILVIGLIVIVVYIKIK